MDRFLNIAAYHFVPLDDLSARRKELRLACISADLRGTILLSREGINLFIAGLESPLRSFLQRLTDKPEFAGLEVKESWSDRQPFNRMLVRLKTEIISMGVDGIDPRNRPSPKLKAKELKQWLDEGRELVLLDVRNDYEIGVGTFAGAKAIGVDHFRNFPAAVSTLPDELKDKPVVMFCTGGIRCEKAGPFMEQQGYQNVYQLDGGILKYFEECGSAHYDGDCFVFDKRVALNPELKPSGLGLCFACQAILTPEEMKSPLYVGEQSCPHCFKETSVRPSVEARTAAIAEFASPLPGALPYDNMRPIRIPERLDGTTMTECLDQLYGHFGDAFWAEELRLGRIRLGDRIADGETIVKAGQRYSHWFPDTVEPDVNANIDVLYEDDALLVINKPAPLPMHPSGRFNRNTLSWILRGSLQIHGLRPVHRLDANTTGIAIFAKTRAVAGEMQRQFDALEVSKIYLAQCIGVPDQLHFCCNAPIARTKTKTGGREIAGEADNETDADGQTDFVDENAQADAAQTNFVRRKVLQDGTSLLEAMPITGRTNQIRVHLWHLGFPIVGDPTYLPGHILGEIQTLDVAASMAQPMRLHAWKVEFRHPQTRQLFELVAPRPSWFEDP